MSQEYSKNQDWNYERAMAEIEEIITAIESGKMPLDQVLEQFAIAVERWRECQNFLAEGKERMNLLIEILDNE